MASRTVRQHRHSVIGLLVQLAKKVTVASPIVSLVGLTLLTLPTPHPRDSATCIPDFISRFGLITCYLPAQAAQAERRLHLRLLPPQAVVKAVTGLSLTQVDSYDNPAPKPGGFGVTFHPYSIIYVFGYLPGHIGGCTTQQSPQYVDVSEQPFDPLVKRVRIARENGNPTCPWDLWANVDSRLSIHLTSNRSYAVIQRLGTLLLRAAHRP